MCEVMEEGSRMTRTVGPPGGAPGGVGGWGESVGLVDTRHQCGWGRTLGESQAGDKGLRVA